LTPNKYIMKIYLITNLMILILCHNYLYFLYIISQIWHTKTLHCVRIAFFSGRREYFFPNNMHAHMWLTVSKKTLYWCRIGSLVVVPTSQPLGLIKIPSPVLKRGSSLCSLYGGVGLAKGSSIPSIYSLYFSSCCISVVLS
jgi:hypothetical protein